MTNNAVLVSLIETSLDDMEPPAGRFQSSIRFGGSRYGANPCEHETTVCDRCLIEWAWDYWIDLTPGVVRTFIMRYGRFPDDVAVLDDAGLVINPDVHLRIPNVTAIKAQLERGSAPAYKKP